MTSELPKIYLIQFGYKTNDFKKTMIYVPAIAATTREAAEEYLTKVGFVKTKFSDYEPAVGSEDLHEKLSLEVFRSAIIEEISVFTEVADV